MTTPMTAASARTAIDVAMTMMAGETWRVSIRSATSATLPAARRIVERRLSLVPIAYRISRLCSLQGDGRLNHLDPLSKLSLSVAL